MAARVSLAELADSGFILDSAEAAAIVLGVCRQFLCGDIRGIPSTHVIRLTPDGTLLAEGPITTDQSPIAKAALLLNDLLPPFDAVPAYRVPGALRLVVARALGTLDLPPFGSLDEFCIALSRFAADDLVSTTRNLYRAWELAKAPRTPTISDLRRARRATGLSLDDISSVCGVNSALLRELEWGYLKNWRNDAVGLSWLSGYAKASGLDEQLVRSIVVPMLDEARPRHLDGGIAADQHHDRDRQVALVASSPVTIVPAARSEARPEPRWWMVWAGASAAAVLLLAIVTTLAWPRPAVQAEPTAAAFVPPPPPAPVRAAAPAPVTASAPAPVTTPAPAPAATPVHVAHTRAATKRPVSKAHAPAKRADPPVPAPAPKPSFFERPLLRIVIK